MRRIFVVTVDYNSHEETHNLLASLKKVKQHNFTLSVVVVDNASKTALSLTKEEKKMTQLFTTEKNLGFTGGYNKGVREALQKNADYVVILNNDTLVDQYCFEQFLATARKYPDIGIIVPKIYFAPHHEFHKENYSEKERGKVFWYAGGFMDWANVFSRHRGVDEVDNGQYEKMEKIDFATGCCMFVPAKVLKKVGLFDEQLFLYFEDADLSKRVLQAGFEIIYDPKAIIWHVNAASGGGAGSILHDYYITRNRMIFGMKYASIRTKLALLRESMRLLVNGREWQKKGIKDYYLHHFGKGSFGQ